jgi:hypothetical protein
MGGACTGLDGGRASGCRNHRCLPRQAGDRYTISNQTPRLAAVASEMGQFRTCAAVFLFATSDASIPNEQAAHRRCKLDRPCRAFPFRLACSILFCGRLDGQKMDGGSVRSTAPSSHVVVSERHRSIRRR